MATSTVISTLCTWPRSEEHTSELQSQSNLVCRLLLEKKTRRLVPATLGREYRQLLDAVGCQPSYICRLIKLQSLPQRPTDRTGSSGTGKVPYALGLRL